jgi:alpha,alpha-trehalose phosphorylase
VHIAAMAGSWLGVVAGFAGLRMHRGVPAFAPQLPRAWTRYAFRLRVGAAQLRLVVDEHGSHYRLIEGTTLALQHNGQPLTLHADQPLSIFTA